MEFHIRSSIFHIPLSNLQRDTIQFMKRRSPSLGDKLISWWRAPASPLASARQRACEADPSGMLAELQEEQGMLAAELEDTFRAYDERVQDVAKRLAGVGGEPVGKKELAHLRKEQHELWRLVRRAQASSRTTRELQSELKEWLVRPVGAAPFGHPDHPATRAELVASELRVRGVGVSPAGQMARWPEGLSEGSVLDAGSMPELFEEKALADGDLAVEPEEEDAPEWEHEDEAILLEQLRNRKREMERILKTTDQETDEDAARELAMFLGEQRELHAHLREHDRRTGVSRERWGIGMPDVE
jgi:hypothetical protein